MNHGCSKDLAFWKPTRRGDNIQHEKLLSSTVSFLQFYSPDTIYIHCEHKSGNDC